MMPLVELAPRRTCPPQVVQGKLKILIFGYNSIRVRVGLGHNWVIIQDKANAGC